LRGFTYEGDGVVLKMLDLFSGIGGFSLAAEWTGHIETVAFCEIDKYCTQVLNKHWPNVPVYPDIKELRGEDIGAVDIVCGGFPCQPFSVAGRRRGKEDDRYLWPEMFRIIQETKPPWVVGENVANFVGMELESSISDLESEGYETQAFIIPACGVEAPHERARTWILAHSGRSLRQGNVFRGADEKQAGTENAGQTERSSWTSRIILANSGCKRLQVSEQERKHERPVAKYSGWPTEPNVDRVAYGVSHRVDRIRGLGNAIVPQAVYQILQGIVDIEGVMI
jgi:DNA (cytosine-5)-methyltransferase 1